MKKTCSKCGKIHEYNYKCTVNKTPYNSLKYSTEESKLRNTNKWHKKAEQIKKDSKYLCEVCFDKGIYNYSDLEVHHIIKLREDKTKLLDNYNLICLCRSCHKLADAEMINKNYLLNLAKKRESKSMNN